MLPAPAPPAVSAALARLLAPLPAAPAPAAGAAAASAGYTTLPLLSTLLQVDEALERRTAQGASAGTSGASCEGTLKFAEEHAHTTILRARGIVATFPALWTEFVAGPLRRCAPPSPSPPPSRALTPPPPLRSWSEEGRLQRVLRAGSCPGL